MDARTSGVALWGGLIVALVAPVAAQHAARADGPVDGQATGLSWQRGVICGGGPDFRVRFDDSGAVFTPALGRRAARTHPLRWTTESIRRGDTEVWGAGAADGPLRIDDRTVVRDLAPDVAEHVAVRPEGIELSYEFGRELGGSGDLVVRIRVDTDLAPVASGARAGLALHAEGVGGVRIGGVTGIDARSWRAGGELRFDGGYLDLVLPAAFVDHAAYPLVLDPLINADFAVATGWDDAAQDVAFDATEGIYLAVWQRAFSATDVDIRAQRVDTSGTLVGGFITVTRSIGGDVAMHPTVANVNDSDRFLVAWQEGPSIIGPWDIAGCCVSAADGALSGVITIAGTTADEINPDAGSESTTSDNEAILVWEEPGTGIYAKQVTCPSGTGDPVAFATVTISSDPSDRRPAISKTGGTTGRHMITWGRFGDIYAACVDRNVNVLETNFLVLDGFGAEPDVDGDGTDFLVAWQEAEPFPGTSRDIRCQRLTYTSAIAAVGIPSALAADPDEAEIRPAVGYLGHKYLVAWAAETGPLQYDIEVLAVAPASCRPCGRVVTLSGGGFGLDIDPQIASRASGGSGGDEAMIVWTDARSGPPFESEVWAQLFEGVGSGGTITSLGGGCGGGGTASGSGPFAIGNPTFTFTLSGTDPAAGAAVFTLGVFGTPPIPCGTCALTVPVLQLGVPVVGGTSKLNVPVPCNVRLIGGKLEVQWWVAGTTTSPCRLARGISFSDRVVATVGT